MHNLGILHCDLRPKNFLVDEYGILKISDFKSARKLPKGPLGDQNKNQNDGNLGPESRGTTAYMSPELFTSEGVHSYSSDFWAMGCVLYELRRGVPPFGWEYSSSSASVSTKELIDRINTAEPVGNPIVFADNNENNNGNNNGNNNAYISNNSSNKEKDNKSDRTYVSRNMSNVHPNVTPSVTSEFADILKWLLEKFPSDRCTW